jgi:hypothetical protein
MMVQTQVASDPSWNILCGLTDKLRATGKYNSRRDAFIAACKTRPDLAAVARVPGRGTTVAQEYARDLGIKRPATEPKVSAEGQLEELARKRAKANNSSIFAEYERLLHEPQGKALYDAFLREKKGRRK